MASNETELFKDKIEVSLDGRQIFYLFFGGAVIATLVFVLGVMVGRRVEARTIAEAGTTVSDPLAALDRLEGENELAFPTALRGDDVSLGAVDATLASRSELSEKAAAATKAEAAAAAAAAAELKATERAADKARAAEKASKQKSADALAAKAGTKAAKVAAAEAAKALAKEEGAEVEVKPKAKRRRFTLQVGSFQDKLEADTFFRNLATSSYKPYMVEADVPGKGKYFRVRVGGYASFEEAVEAKAQFEQKQHVIAYVTRLK